jgi:hypothetical protein
MEWVVLVFTDVFLVCFPNNLGLLLGMVRITTNMLYNGPLESALSGASKGINITRGI